MKITKQEYKQVSFTVDIDLDSIKAVINELDEMLRDEAFTADEANVCCKRIEELAQAISRGVENK